MALGTTTAAYVLALDGQTLELAPLQEAWEARMEPVFPYRRAGEEVKQLSFDVRDHDGRRRPTPKVKLARPRVVIPVFSGNNCEYDNARAFRAAGAEVTTLVINNLSPQAVAASTRALADEIGRSQIVMIPGGFSGGDERSEEQHV